MNIEQHIKITVVKAVKTLYNQDINSDIIQIQKTRKEFTGDLTLVVFPFLRFSRKSPDITCNEIGNFLKEEIDDIFDFNVIKGFLNLAISPRYWLSFLNFAYSTPDFGFIDSENSSKTVMIEYSSPNTNKPLHLGHIRNNLIGYSVASILKANGYKVIKTNLVNDRGIHICKSMLAWLKWGNGITPEKAGVKGDHLVGDYYVKFDQEYKKQIQELEAKGMSKEEAEKNAPLINEAQEMLRKWEAKDPEVIELWKKMNQWVYEGFDVTYKTLGVDFDKIYYESQTYLLGKSHVLKGLENGVLFQKEDGSVWADLTGDGLDQKLLLRSDGTSVYMTQDIGTAEQRFNQYHMDQMIYVVGNEQNYHFQVLKLVLDKLGFHWSKKIKHLSYGMVELPNGKMKSREGTVVDADDLMEEMFQTARDMSEELGKLEGLSEEEKNDIVNIIGLGALKYFILKVDPKKNMTFNPAESIDFNGNTGPFIQYAYARIQSLMRKAEEMDVILPETVKNTITVNEKERELIKLVDDFPGVIREAGNALSPALIANYAYELVKEYNQFYHDFSILKEEDADIRNLRLILSKVIGQTLFAAMKLMGINMPERM